MGQKESGKYNEEGENTVSNEDNTDNTKDNSMETEDECHGNKVIDIEKKETTAEFS